MAVVFSNNATTALASSVTSSATSITVQDGSVFPTLSGSDYTYITLEDLAGNVEIVKLTARSVNVLTIVRAQDGTSARAFGIGSKCELRLTAALLNEVAAQADTDTNTTYTAGSGLALTGTVFSNTSPDRTVALTGAGATSISGTYPNFTITSTDTNTVYTHPSSHPISFITGLQAALDGKVDDSQVLTNVPAGALFTDTVYTLPFADNSANWNTSYTYSQVGHLPLAGGTLTGGLTAPNIGVTNIVTNKVVKFNGTILDDSNITDTGSVITLGTSTNITGSLVSSVDITAGGYLQATSYLYTRNDLRVLNAAGTGWTTWGTRSNGNYNLNVGTITATGGNSTNWNTAYGWGNHASQSYATQSYVGTAISNLVDSSPATLDTLNELAAALGDDPNFATTVTNSIATKLPLAGGTLTGTLNMGANAITSTGTISSGAITATGNSSVLGVGSTGNAFQVFRGSDGAGALRVMNTGEVIVSSNYFYVDASQGSYFSSTARFRGTISNDIGTDVTIADTLNVTEGIKLNGTTVIDSSRNLTNIGTLNGGTPWTSANDGSGSGLDADLLDGQQGSYYATAASVSAIAALDPVITLTGAVTGSGTMTNLGNVSIATTATADPTLTLTGDVTGAATFTNLGNATLTATVADDSHDHTALPRFIEGAGATGAWTGTHPDIEAYTDGMVVWYKISFNGAATTTLNINGLGAKTIYRSGTSKLTTHWPVNSVIPLVYSATLNGGCFLGGYGYDSNQTYDLRWSSAVVNGTSIIHGYQLLMEGADTKFYPVTVGGAANSTTNVVQTAPLRIGGQMLYYSSSSDIAANAAITNNLLYESIETGEGEYWMNRTSSSSWTAIGLPLYIVGTVNANNELILDNSTTTAFLTNALPTTEDGKIYVHVGYSDNEDDLWRLSVTHPIFEFKAGAIRRYTPALIPSEVLDAVKTVDGASSGLDADLLDGQQGSYYATAASVAAVAALDPVITLTGAVTGTGTMTNLGSVSITTTNTADPVLTLTGDVTGSATFTNLGNATLTAVVADDSHNHIISNVDGLQTALDSKLNLTGGTVWGTLTLDNGGSSSTSLVMKGTSPTISLLDDDTNADDFYIHINSNRFYILANRTDTEVDLVGTGWENPHPMYLDSAANTGYLFDQRMFSDSYHPNADTWTTARTLGVTLTGDVTGSATMSVNGGSNQTATITTVVANDSHSHSNYMPIQMTTPYSVIPTGGWAGYNLGNGTMLQSSSTGLPSGGTHGYWHVTGRRDSGGGYVGLYFQDYSGSAGMWIGKSLTSADPTWERVWSGGTDGSGSGLDADLLDGQQGSYYAPASHVHSYLPLSGGTVTGATSLRAGGTHLGNHEFASASGTSTGYSDAGIEIREGAYGGSASFSAPRLAFHWGGVVASNISIDTAGAILIRNNPGTGYENLRANNIYANGTNLVWHTGNDGSGSGLDADLLDGLQSDFAPTVNTIPIRNANGDISAREIVLSSALITATPTVLVSMYPGTNQLVRTTPAAVAAGMGAWTTANDGSGSGLDADLLDGQQGSYYYPASNPSGYNNYTHPAYTARSLNTTGAQVLDILTTDAIGSVTNATTRTMTLADLGYTGATNANYITNNNQLTNGAGYVTPAGGVNYLISNMGVESSAGQYWQASGQTTTYAPTGGWWNTWRGSHGDPVSYYSNTLAIAMTDSDRGTIYTQTIQGGTLTGWNKFWHSNNDGSGSGLDADLLDGINSSSFLRSDVNDTATGSITFDQASQYFRKNAQTNYVSASLLAESYGGGATKTGVGFHISGSIGKWVNMDASGVLRWDSDTFWHSGNDGSGSGLDADLLDGYNSDNFLGKFGNSYYQANNWIQSTGEHGLYMPSINNAHFYPNNTASYGTWRIIGSRNGYTGIHLDYGNVNTAMYDSGGNGGEYNSNWGWYTYFNRDNGCLGVAGSSTSSSYGLYEQGGGIYSTGNIVAYSDRRVKENIRTIDNALETVEQMRGVYYNRIDDEEKKTVIGFIAQEVDEVEGAKPLVTYAADVDQYGVSYGNATALLVEAIKELSQQVKDLQKEIKELKNA